MDITLVKEVMRLSPAFVLETESLSHAIEKMKAYNEENIYVAKEDLSLVGHIYKKDITGKFNENLDLSIYTNTLVKEIIKDQGEPLVLYPRMTIKEAYSIITFLKKSHLPVVALPWEKKIIGFLWLKDILPIVEKSYIKVPV